ncbi:MAG: sortase domain-bontaining protein [Chloroflexota bacterium]
MTRSVSVILLLAAFFLLTTSWALSPTQEPQEVYPTTQPTAPPKDAVVGGPSEVIAQTAREVGLSADLVETYGLLGVRATASAPNPSSSLISTPSPETSVPIASAAPPFDTANTIPAATFTATVEAVSPVPTPVLANATSTMSPPQPTEFVPTGTPTSHPIPTSTRTPTRPPKPTPTATAEPTKSGVATVAPPKLLRLPTVGIEAAFEFVGLTPEGAMDTPKNPDKVAWYQFGPRPGQPGNAVIAGHVDWAGKVRAFWWLNRLEPGDVVEIIDQKDNSYSFVIKRKQLYDASTAPVQEIFAGSGAPEITLITCGGVFDHRTRQYLSRLVVRAALQ